MQNESHEPETASLFPDEVGSAHEKKILRLLKADESTHIDQMVELLENEMSSSEIFAALFELELNGKIRQLPGKNFVKSFQWSIISCQSSVKSGGASKAFAVFESGKRRTS
jgi:DNA processing protein